MPWYAHRDEQHGRALYWNLSTDRRWTEIHEYPMPIVEVNVVEVPEGEATETDYWGWHMPGEEHPVFIYPVELLLAVCFPYGIAAAVSRGHGRVVRLRVTPVVADPTKDGAA